MKREKLKKILEKDDTEEGVIEFENIITNGETSSGLHEQDINLLLRWAVQEQKKYFHDYYRILIK